MRSCTSLAVALLLLITSPAGAVTVRVPLDEPTIQQAIDATSSGDTVLVAPGVYTGALNRNLEGLDRGITVTSEGGSALTVIDCEGVGRGFHFGSLWSTPAVVEGFTIRNAKPPFGEPPYRGGGMWLGGEATVRDCLFEDCRGGEGGGGIDCTTLARIVDCTFLECWAVHGGGVRVYGSSTVEGCVFISNEAALKGGGVFAGGYGSNAAIIENCTFVGNVADHGGAVYCWSEEVHVLRSAMAFNSGGGAVTCDDYLDDHVLRNNVLFENSGGDSLCGSYSDNLFTDPLFCGLYEDSPVRMDLGLCANSPCLPDNNSWGLSVGALGEACEQCVSPVESMSWGRLKSLFRP